MLFKKNKVIDLTELQRKGVIKSPKKEKTILENKEGFVDLSLNQSNSSSDPFLFLSSKNIDSAVSNDFYKKREIDKKIEELDNKIYKLEQRIELLERKLGVGNYSSY